MNGDDLTSFIKEVGERMALDIREGHQRWAMLTQLLDLTLRLTEPERREHCIKFMVDMATEHAMEDGAIASLH